MNEQTPYEPVTRADRIKIRLDEIFEYLCWYCETYPGTSPTIRDIQMDLEISSTSMTIYYLNKLVKQGRVMRIKGTCRAYVPVGGCWIRPSPLVMVNNPSEKG